MKLILVGGVHGVGKTTLLDYLAKKIGGTMRVFDPGAYFWKHLIEAKDKTPAEIEAMVVNELAKTGKEEVVVCNWHYAVWTKDGYVPQLAYDNLERIVSLLAPEKIILMLVTASAEDIHQRRKKDLPKRKRKIGMRYVLEEIEATESAFAKHLRVLEKHTDVWFLRLDNTKLRKAKKLLLKIVRAEIQ